MTKKTIKSKKAVLDYFIKNVNIPIDRKNKTLDLSHKNKKMETKTLDIPPDYTGIVKFRNQRIKYSKGKIHKISGPAVEHSNFTYEFWLNGMRVQFKEWLEQYTTNFMVDEDNKKYVKEIKELKEENKKLKEQNEKINNELNKIYGKPAEKVDLDKDTRFSHLEVD